jgi:V/A-type H+-transporting ATPase subunit E
MSSTDENIKALSRAVLADAQGKAQQIMADAIAKADGIRLHAKEQAKVEKEQILARAYQEAEQIRNQSIASAHLKARTILLEQREKVLMNVFEQASQEITALQQGTDYENIVVNLLKDALLHLGDKQALIRADQKTQACLTKDLLADISKETGISLKLGRPLQQGIGVMVQTMDGHRQYDNTFEARLQRMWDSLRGPVYHILMGEP